MCVARSLEYELSISASNSGMPMQRQQYRRLEADYYYSINKFVGMTKKRTATIAITVLMLTASLYGRFCCYSLRYQQLNRTAIEKEENKIKNINKMLIILVVYNEEMLHNLLYRQERPSPCSINPRPTEERLYCYPIGR